MLRWASIVFAALALAAAAGCRGFDIAQTCIFADEDGNVVTVGYGSADKPHKNSYVNPWRWSCQTATPLSPGAA